MNEPMNKAASAQAETSAAQQRVLDANGTPQEGLPSSYNNIDEQGRVLYLDRERRTRKEQPNKPLYSNRPNGLGIKNFIVTHCSARQWNWKLVLALFRKLVAWSAYMRQPGSWKSKLYKRAMYFDPAESMYSTGSIYNLNVDTDCEHEEEKPGTHAYNDKRRSENGTEEFDVSVRQHYGSGSCAEGHEDERHSCDTMQAVHTSITQKGKTIQLNETVATDARKVTVPMDLVKRAIREAEFIGGMKECLCRAGKDCQTYPHDLACLFLNRAGHVVVDHGMAVPLTAEEAIARVDRAAELGLTCQSLWVEVEQLIWGFRNDEMDSFMEICFCCPCCCVALNLSNNATTDVKRRFSPSGWTAVVNYDACIGCKGCTKPYCPQDAIHFRESDGKMVVDQEVCVGCGICRAHCPQGAISIKQTMPMRGKMHDYFLEEGRLAIHPTPQVEEMEVKDVPLE